jgi:hypothetical protein
MDSRIRIQTKKSYCAGQYTVVFLILALQLVSTLFDLCERMVGEDVGVVARVVAHSTVCVATEGLFYTEKTR